MNDYNELCSYGNLLKAYIKARKGKTAKWYVKEFGMDFEKNLMKLEAELRYTKYKPSPMQAFVVREPKTRVISVPDFRDRVVHHAMNNILELVFEKVFIFDSYAGRKQKGLHAAVERFDVFMRKVSMNGKLVKNPNDNMIIGYVMKADVKHYFDTVDHEILLKIISKQVKDQKILQLVKCIITNESGKGMPIGTLASQFFANIYLNELDYFVKHKLHAKYYIRYMDDFVVLHKNKQQLEKWKFQINKFLGCKLKLELHPEKTKIYPLSKGVKFLGFRIFYRYKLLKKSNVRQIKNRIDYFKSLYHANAMSKDEIHNSFEGWEAYAMHAQTYRMRRRMKRQINEMFNNSISPFSARI